MVQGVVIAMETAGAVVVVMEEDVVATAENAVATPKKISATSRPSTIAIAIDAVIASGNLIATATAAGIATAIVRFANQIGSATMIVREGVIATPVLVLRVSVTPR